MELHFVTVDSANINGKALCQGRFSQYEWKGTLARYVQPIEMGRHFVKVGSDNRNGKAL